MYEKHTRSRQLLHCFFFFPTTKQNKTKHLGVGIPFTVIFISKTNGLRNSTVYSSPCHPCSQLVWCSGWDGRKYELNFCHIPPGLEEKWEILDFILDINGESGGVLSRAVTWLDISSRNVTVECEKQRQAVSWGVGYSNPVVFWQTV